MYLTRLSTGVYSDSPLTSLREFCQMTGNFLPAPTLICSQQESNHVASVVGNFCFQTLSNSLNLKLSAPPVNPNNCSVRGAHSTTMAFSLTISCDSFIRSTRFA